MLSRKLARQFCDLFIFMRNLFMQFLLKLCLGKSVIIHFLLIFIEFFLKYEVALLCEARLVCRLFPSHRRRNTQDHPLRRIVSEWRLSSSLSDLSHFSHLSRPALRSEALLSGRRQRHKIDRNLGLCCFVVALGEWEWIDDAIFLFVENCAQVQHHLPDLHPCALCLQLE